MSQMADEFDRAKSRMLGDFNRAISEAAEQRESAADAAGEGIVAARAELEEKSARAKARPAVATPAAGTAGEKAAAIDVHVQDSP